MTTTASRRSFLRASLLAAAGLPAYQTLIHGDEPAKAPASDRVRLGFIGLGGMGTSTLQAFLAQPDVEVTALCDVFDPHAARARELTKNQADTTKDFRKLLDRQDVDAVVISTPDHWHGLIALAALKAGKHVYCEKPLTHNIAEGTALVRAAATAKLATQMGIQVRAGENYHRVVELIRGGAIGRVHKVHVWVCRGPMNLGSPANGKPPAGLDWDLWLGPCPNLPFNTNRFLFHWRWFWDHGGGLLGDMGCHVLDLVHWALQADAPTSVAASGGKLATVDNTETPDTMEAVYEYPGFVLTWSHSFVNPLGRERRGLGVQFVGTQGTLTADYDSFELKDLQGKEMQPPQLADALPRSPGHHRDWLRAIKEGKPTTAPFAYGHRLTTVCHLGNLALALGRKLYWDGQAERFVKDASANRRLGRDYRKPWALG